MDHQSSDPQNEVRPFPVVSRAVEGTREVSRSSTSARSLEDVRSSVPWGAERRVNAWRDLIVLSHLRWDLVFQRPQHLLTRCARERRVFFIEEPLFTDGPLRSEIQIRENGVRRVLLHLPHGIDEASILDAQRQLIDMLFAEQRIGSHVLWYYTPMALPFTRHLKPLAVVYDCMDELSAFAGAPPALRQREAELMKRADLVLTGGQSLYEAKRHLHPQVYPFPSSVDVAHFARARQPQRDPADQASIPHPRIGFFGVIDERFDIELMRELAALEPDWHFVLLGPVVKIDPRMLPQAPNLHYLGSKGYLELPSYLSGWDVAILPFARNESTRFISPTKTPEYLAAGCPVVSTSIRDVVRPYGRQGLARIADTPAEFVEAIEAALHEDAAARQVRADAFLSQMSWDLTWSRMRQLVDGVARVKLAATGAPVPITGQPGSRPTV
jgi:UDP-galactopyranose mutase